MTDFESFDIRAWIKDGLLLGSINNSKLPKKRMSGKAVIVALSLVAAFASTSAVALTVQPASQTPTVIEKQRSGADISSIGNPEVYWDTLIQDLASWKEVPASKWDDLEPIL